ncbi:cell surface protein, partial [Bacteroides fragilis]|nr:cell surface protein [Bacteroides fragilis]
SGPGAVYVFETTGFGDIESVTDSGDLELRSGEVINQPYPAHRHVNWAFSEPGTYTMTVQASSNGDTSNKVTYSGPGAVYVFETTGFGDIESVTDSGDLELRSGEV